LATTTNYVVNLFGAVSPVPCVPFLSFVFPSFSPLEVAAQIQLRDLGDPKVDSSQQGRTSFCLGRKRILGVFRAQRTRLKAPNGVPFIC